MSRERAMAETGKGTGEGSGPFLSIQGATCGGIAACGGLPFAVY